jgi:hypothetical protein
VCLEVVFEALVLRLQGLTRGIGSGLGLGLGNCLNELDQGQD